MRHRSDKSDPMDVGERAYQVDDEYDGDWDEGQVLGKKKAKGKLQGKAEGAGKGAGKSTQSKPWQCARKTQNTSKCPTKLTKYSTAQRNLASLSAYSFGGVWS